MYRLRKNDPTYGRPEENSLSQMRARAGEARMRAEICDVCEAVFHHGQRSGTDYRGFQSIGYIPAEGVIPLGSKPASGFRSTGSIQISRLHRRCMSINPNESKLVHLDFFCKTQVPIRIFLLPIPFCYS